MFHAADDARLAPTGRMSRAGFMAAQRARCIAESLKFITSLRRIRIVTSGTETGAPGTLFDTMPNSQIVVSYSTRYYKFVDGENVVMPDKLIEPTWPAYKSGRDPVLDWILSGDKKP